MADLLHFIGFKAFSIRGKNFHTFLLFTFYFLLLPFVFCVNALAQDETPDTMPDNIAPPVFKAISKDEKTALAGVSDVKERTKLTIDLMEVRLKKAEEQKTNESYTALLDELGTFEALMDDALKFLDKNDNGRGKFMDTSKRFEMALRSFMPRLELIRREVPTRFEYHVRKLLKNVRDARAKAVEPFFSSTVVPDKN